MKETDATRISYVYVRNMPSNIGHKAHTHHSSTATRQGRRGGLRHSYFPKCDTPIVERLHRACFLGGAGNNHFRATISTQLVTQVPLFPAKAYPYSRVSCVFALLLSLGRFNDDEPIKWVLDPAYSFGNATSGPFGVSTKVLSVSCPGGCRYVGEL